MVIKQCHLRYLLLERHNKRGDQNECSFFWLHLKQYEDDCVINTDNKSVQQIVGEIKVIADSKIKE
ncbi:MAG: hypothetical protein NC245_00965 [Muribaculum sp.]|nr:hypothetical protein [Ruminococcus flavefaciens]MCM1373644.1 hypothetical protein [Muribaculum sp.]